MHYRKRPVVIEAWLASDLLYAAAKEWKLLPDSVKEAYEEGDVIFHDTYITIATLEGTHRAEKTDMVIRGVKGELYPCKPDIFEATYEAVAENVVKHYNEQAHPSIKGNGFDGLVVGDYREEAETFIKFVNELIAAQSIGGKAAQTNNSQSVAALVEIVTAELAYCGILAPLGFLDHITDKFNQRLNCETQLHT